MTIYRNTKTHIFELAVNVFWFVVLHLDSIDGIRCKHASKFLLLNFNYKLSYYKKSLYVNFHCSEIDFHMIYSRHNISEGLGYCEREASIRDRISPFSYASKWKFDICSK